MYWAVPRLLIQSSIRGNGNASGTVTEFTFPKSMQKRSDPSALGTKIHGELQGLLLFLAKSFWTRYSTSCFMISLYPTGQRYGFCFIGTALPTSMACLMTEVPDGTSLNSPGKLSTSLITSCRWSLDKWESWKGNTFKTSEFFKQPFNRFVDILNPSSPSSSARVRDSIDTCLSSGTFNSLSGEINFLASFSSTT